MTLDDIRENFSLLDDWEDRYRYVIELGKALPPLDDALKTEDTKVRGCASQVWLISEIEDGRFRLGGDSDAHIVRGLIAILFAIYADRRIDEVMAQDAGAVFRELGLHEHLTPQRSNGFSAMVERIKADASQYQNQQTGVH